MKKSIVLPLVLLLGLASCKKDQTQSPELLEGDQVTSHASDTAPVGPLTTLALSEAHWDFKDVTKGQSVEHVYEVTNTGENPLIISEVVPGCGCTAPEFTKDPILPGEKGQVMLRFDSSSFDGFQNKQAQVYANVENAPVIISFTANVVKP